MLNDYTCTINRGRKGFTLVETIIVLALISIVGLIAFSINLFGNKVFGKSSDKYNLISETNLASEYITKYIRFAYGVEILDKDDEIPSSTKIADSSDPENSYIFVEKASGKCSINYRDKNGTKKVAEFTDCTLNFERTNNNKALIFTIDSRYKNEKYSVNSGVVPINLFIQSDSDIVDNTGVENGVALRIVNKVSTISEGTLIFNPADPPSGVVGTEYVGTYTLSASGGTPPYAYALLNNTRLPYGMVLSSDGRLSGIPLEAGIFSVWVFAYDSSSPVRTATNIIVINIKNNVTVAPNAPEARNIRIIGKASVGNSLSVDYDYYDPLGASEGATEFMWYRGSKSNGSDMVQISGESSSTYIVKSEDVNKYIFVSVTPYNGKSYGTKVYCDFPVVAEATADNTAPYVDGKIDITCDKGKYAVGATLTGTFKYKDNENDPPGTHRYQWYRGSSKYGNDMVAIPNATSQSYTLTNDDVGYYIFLEVTPMATSGVTTGVPSLSTNIGKIQKK